MITALVVWSPNWLLLMPPAPVPTTAVLAATAATARAAIPWSLEIPPPGGCNRELVGDGLI